MTRPPVLVAIAAWLVVVTGVSTLVWGVISRAGGELSAPQEPLVARTADTVRDPSPTSSAQQAPQVERRTWQGSGELVTAACDGPAIRLVSAQPLDGFHADVKDNGPDELEVEFEGGEDRSGSDVTVVARCLSGVPDIAVQAEDD